MNKNYVKIVLLGDGRVGKTSILNKYINNKFNDTQEMTINSGYLEKDMTYDGDRFTFCFWDTAGQEKFDALTPIYYRDAKGAVLVYDTTISDSFKKVKKWATELKAFNPNTIIVLAGNKADLRKFDIDRETVMQYAEEINAKHYYTSAKTGEGLNELFNSITNDLAKSLISKPGKRKITVKIDGEVTKPQKKNCC